MFVCCLYSSNIILRNEIKCGQNSACYSSKITKRFLLAQFNLLCCIFIRWVRTTDPTFKQKLNSFWPILIIIPEGVKVIKIYPFCYDAFNVCNIVPTGIICTSDYCFSQWVVWIIFIYFIGNIHIVIRNTELN